MIREKRQERDRRGIEEGEDGREGEELQSTHIVSHLEEVLEAAVHPVVVHGHEECVDDDAERDEQLHKWVKHQQLHQLGKLIPEPTTVPHTEDVNAFQQIL